MDQLYLRRCALVGSVCLSVFGILSSSYAQRILVGRYVSVPVQPQHTQQDLLQQLIQIKFPKRIHTIEQALKYMLRFSGYRLVDVKKMDPSVFAILQQSLPEVDRNFGPMTLQQGLRTLLGTPFSLLIDPVHRLVSYRLKGRYEQLYHTNCLIQDTHG